MNVFIFGGFVRKCMPVFYAYAVQGVFAYLSSIKLMHFSSPAAIDTAEDLQKMTTLVSLQVHVYPIGRYFCF